MTPQSEVERLLRHIGNEFHGPVSSIVLPPIQKPDPLDEHEAEHGICAGDEVEYAEYVRQEIEDAQDRATDPEYAFTYGANNE